MATKEQKNEWQKKYAKNVRARMREYRRINLLKVNGEITEKEHSKMILGVK